MRLKYYIYSVLALGLGLASAAPAQVIISDNQTVAPKATGGGGGITYVNGWQTRNGATSSTTVTTSITGGNGDAIVCWVGWANPSSADAITATDSASNTYTLVDNNLVTGGAQYQFATLLALNIAGSPTSITATLNNSRQFITQMCDEYSGVATTAALDGNSSAGAVWSSTTNNAVTSNNFTTTVNNDVVLGGIADISSTGLTPGSGFTQHQYTVSSFMTESKILATAGTTAATATQAGSSSGTTFTVANGLALKP